MKRLLFILAFAVATLTGVGQLNVSGVIVEEGSNEPLTGASVILRNAEDKLYSEDEIPQIDWEISDSTKNVLGYECNLATANLYGRKWNAWFAPEIPVMNGPWKLSGLPGLILEAETEDGLYFFVATGLQQTTQPIGPVYLADRYEKVNRKELLKSKRAFFDNPLGNINSQLGGKDAKLVIQDENGNAISGNQRLFAPREEIDFIETDY